MALYTIQTPATDNWSKNPIRFKLGTTSVVTDSKLLAFSIWAVDRITSVAELAYSGTQRFDANGQSELDIARICDAQLEYYVAKPYDTTITTSQYIVWKKQAKSFFCFFWESDDQVGTLLQSDSFIVVKGGVSKEQHQAAYTADYFFDGSNMRFLTYNKRAYREQGLLFISFYVPTNGTLSRIVRQDIGGTPTLTNYTMAAPVPSAGDVVVLFFDISVLPAAVKQINFYLEDSVVVSEVLSIELINRKFVNSKTYAYINSLGGTEVVFMPYNQIKLSEQSRDTYARLHDNKPFDYTMQVADENFNDNQQEEISTAIDTGELSAAATEQMRELALSPARFELAWDGTVNGSLRYIPVNVTSKKNTLRNNRTQLPTPMYFEITRAVRNSVFTPENTDCVNRISSDYWEGQPSPVADYLYLIIEPLDDPAQFEFAPNAYVAIDYGNNVTDLVTGSTNYTYTDDKRRQVTLAFPLNQGISNLYITNHGKVSKIWGNLPALLNFKVNNQAITTIPKLPAGIANLELTDNLLTQIPELTMTSFSVSIKLQNNLIEDFEVQNIPAGVLYLNLNNNKLSVAQVNYILGKLDTNGLNNGYVNLAGQTPAAAPTGAGITAAANLVTNGWTVITD